MKIIIKPFPAVRVNGKNGRWAPRAIQYHDKMNDLRELLNDNKEYTIKEIIEALIKGNYNLEFFFPVPKSSSKKKKEERKGKPMLQSPDIDNLFKAFTDTVFYIDKKALRSFEHLLDKDNKPLYNDKAIYKLNGIKYWVEDIEDEIGYIDFNILI